MSSSSTERRRFFDSFATDSEKLRSDQRFRFIRVREDDVVSSPLVSISSTTDGSCKASDTSSRDIYFYSTDLFISAFSLTYSVPDMQDNTSES
ncbi:hypothetical protein YC2023_067117 [Brassica napus]